MGALVFEGGSIIVKLEGFFVVTRERKHQKGCALLRSEVYIVAWFVLNALEEGG